MNCVENREKVLRQLQKGEILVLFSGHSVMRSLDEAYPFSVDRNFYYMTSIDAKDMVYMAFRKPDGSCVEELFIEPFDEVMAKWVGGRLTVEEAQALSQLDRISYISEFEERIMATCLTYRATSLTLLCDLYRDNLNQAESIGIQFAKKMQALIPSLQIKDAFQIMATARMIKSEAELAKMRVAQDQTGRAIEAMMRHIQPGMNETEVEAAFDFALRVQGCRQTAFPTIAASGENATTLHYSSNNCVCHDGDLFLCDLGSTYHHYCADISRTFPVNGKFTERQKELYNFVLEGQRRVIEAIRPGKTLRQLNQVLIDYYAEEGEKLGLFDNGQTVSDFYFHGVSHQLGLDTHDVDLLHGQTPLQPNMVITVEPGIYLEKEKIGIRIEDDVVVTHDGCENLSKNIIKTVEEIEAVMAK